MPGNVIYANKREERGERGARKTGVGERVPAVVRGAESFGADW